MIYVYYFFALVQLYFSYRSLRSGLGYLRFFRRELAAPRPDHAPFATVFVPCRGLEEGLAGNLAAIRAQDYPAYEIIFVVDDEQDPASAVIGAPPADDVRGPVREKLVVAGPARESGQKVRNLRRAVPEAAPESRVFVFMDSDARPDPDWLADLVAPLADKRTGCATGYRWFVQRKGGAATHLRSVWNASIASALGEDPKDNFCWGGATAIRRETFEELDVRRRWKGTLSDDFTLTNVLREAGRPIRFVPGCLTASVGDCGFREMLEFTTRQMKITRVCSPGHFRVSLIGSALFVLTFWTGFGLLFFLDGPHFWVILSIVALIFLLGAAKAWVRWRAARAVLGRHRETLRRQFLPQVLLWTVTPFVYLYNGLAALISRRITWRGIDYVLESAERTKVYRKDG